MTDRVGQRFGDYQLLRLLGDGNFGEVYLAERLSDNLLVAVKILNTSLTNQKDLAEFLTEARTITLDHPHIVKLLDFGMQADGTPFLVMAYAPDGTLRDRHPEGSMLPLETIISYVNPIAVALQYAHDRRLIHRDVKPENMLLGPQDQIWLSDFGIAVAAHNPRSQVLQDKVGTVPYMAPEQLQGRPQPASDQYALGIVIYEWLCGSPPFNGTDLEIVSQHLSLTPPSLRDKVPAVPLAVEQVVLKALEKDPDRRFSSVQEFAEALVQAGQTDYHSGYAPQLSASSPHSSVPAGEQVPVEEPIALPSSIQTGARGPLLMMERQAQEQRERPPRPKFKLSIIIGGVVITIMLFSTLVFAIKVYPGFPPNEPPKASPTASTSPTPTHSYPPPGWQLVLNDALKDNSNGYNWATARDSKGSCGFADGAYQVTAVPNEGHLCANDEPNFSNLVFEVQMTIVQGDAGGIIFRRDRDSGDQYYFHISREGTCRFDIMIRNGFSKTLYFRPCPAVHTGLNETNLVAVVANNNIFDLYVNRQFITTVTDPDISFSSGQIGFVANAQDNPTEVLFSNAKVWTPGP